VFDATSAEEDPHQILPSMDGGMSSVDAVEVLGFTHRDRRPL